MWAVVSIIIWILFIVLNARLARNKNRSVVGWVIAAVLFSWLSTIVLALLPARGRV